MKWIVQLSLIVLFSAGLITAPSRRFQTCLPDGIKNDDVVSTQGVKPGAGGSKVKKITVEQTLKAIKARCKDGKLVDTDGKEIYFYRLQGCWGNPPADYQEILQQQQAEIEKLKKRYTVIEMTCNPEGGIIQ
jgi:hypothetical protein